jgi:molybdopterin converting factor small subunit
VVLTDADRGTQPSGSDVSPLSVRCRFFARYGEMVGCDTHDLILHGGATVADAVAAVRERLAGAAGLPVDPLVAVNREHARSDRVLADGDEVAFLPPLAGG